MSWLDAKRIRGMRGHKQAEPPPATASSAQDTAAKIAQMMKREAEYLDRAGGRAPLLTERQKAVLAGISSPPSSHHDGGIMAGFGEKGRTPFMPIAPKMTPAMLDEAMKVMGMPTAEEAKALKPVVIDRDWARLVRHIPDGIIPAADRANAHTFVAEATFLAAECEFFDITGHQSVPVTELPFDYEELRRSDDAVGRIIDKLLTTMVTAQAMEMIEGPRVYGDAVELLAEVAGTHGLYPVVWITPKGPAESIGEHYVIKVAVGWMYAAELEDDDDEA